MPGAKGDIRVRRWHTRHFAEARYTILDGLRMDDPAYQRPLVVGTTARELTTEEFLRAYPHRWPVETNCFIAQDTTAMEMPRAWTEMALERRMRLSLLTGSLLQAIAAATGPLARGPGIVSRCLRRGAWPIMWRAMPPISRLLPSRQSNQETIV